MQRGKASTLAFVTCTELELLVFIFLHQMVFVVVRNCIRNCVFYFHYCNDPIPSNERACERFIAWDYFGECVLQHSIVNASLFDNEDVIFQTSIFKLVAQHFLILSTSTHYTNTHTKRNEEAPPQASKPTIATLGKSEKPGMKDLLRSPSDYFPMIRRGQSTNLEEKEVVSTGWNMEVTSRKEREEALRYVLIFGFLLLLSSNLTR
jgi:hypothetical protein